MFDDHAPRKDTACVGHQIFEQGVLFACQLDPASSPLHLLGDAVEFKISDPEAARAGHWSAPKQRLDSNKKLSKRERLGEIVVRAELHVADFVVYGVARAQYENGNIRIFASDLTQDF